MNMLDKLSADIKEAMKAKNQFTLDVIRMMKSKIMTVSTKGVNDAEAIKIIKTYAKNLKETIELSRKGGREEEAKKTEQELAIVSTYLPKEASEADVESAVAKIVAELKPQGKQDFGKVMKAVMALGINADGAVVKEMVNKAFEKL